MLVTLCVWTDTVTTYEPIFGPDGSIDSAEVEVTKADGTVIMESQARAVNLRGDHVANWRFIDVDVSEKLGQAVAGHPGNFAILDRWSTAGRRNWSGSIGEAERENRSEINRVLAIYVPRLREGNFDRASVQSGPVVLDSQSLASLID